ncbi:synaptophysin-like protein 1 [Rhinichthys klamathensis goyatoka]|uniref:synaptophysin-like protein 1 n=1 Tax=Rhinichthys klamathensis goyatoka TaxID=3034132 RepID=UPI0024B55DFA|nr:synaptophysin-like protein 1 [Rhinichthys klamathensis goyatoka]
MQTGFRLNLSPVREPLGFVKVVEWLTAVVAFGTCGGYTGRTQLSIFCAGGDNETLTATLTYPFRLNQERLLENNATLCNRTVAETHLVGDSSSAVEFFVAVAVLAFLYSMVALLVYLGYMHVYRDSDFGPMFDFVLTSAFAFLWLVCSSAWARGLQTVKDATGTAGMDSTLALCRDAGVRCEVTEFASMRLLNISVVFGYLNLLIWVGNAWFVYKETRWHSQKVNAQPAAGRGPATAHI